MPGFYEMRMLRLFEQYELSDNARVMFQALEEFSTARLDEASLGRLVRLSPGNRAALVNTMVKCAGIMKDKPKESKYCLDIITSCGQMLEIADKPIPGAGFPGFLQLPQEIRDRIYKFYLGYHLSPRSIIPHPKLARCACAPHEAAQYMSYRVLDLELGFTSKQISNEFWTIFYRKRMFHFPCVCEMNFHLENNVLLKSTIKNLMFHWCGEDADKGILQLQSIEQLENMVVVVSKTTSRYLTKREADIRQFFDSKRNIVGNLPESLGWDELLEIRGLRSVEVVHIDKRKGDRRTDQDRRNLENMLRFYLTRPRLPASDNL
ncbi:hypothetical protein F5Y09DRAFT_349718 [Xylaria sp. FL1042]|nr:hypothetical protein F5Y09DRAFT_349718 [Xylaria sp. FL1042]